MCGSVSALRYLIPGLDACPPVEKDLDGPGVAQPSKIVQRGFPTLLEIEDIGKLMSASKHTVYMNNPKYVFKHACFFYIVRGIDVDSSVYEQSHHLRAVIASS